jgi:glycosyltransferase involved in cell wall biosynthesis
MMNVSVVIPIYNEEKTIEKTIRSLLHQNYRGKFEIIVVDSESTDKTVEIVKNFLKKSKKIKLFFIKDRNIAKARNVGIKNSRGEIIAFIDAGRIAPKNWMKKIVEILEDKNIEGVGGGFRLLNKSNLNVFEKFTALDKIYRTESKRKYVDIVCTGNAAFRKKAITGIGGFDEKFAKRGENSDFCYRMVENNGKILASPDIFVYYNDSYDIKKFLKEHFLNGYYHLFLYLKHNKKMFGDDYKRNFLVAQCFVFLISLFLIITNPYFMIFFIFFFLILNINFFKFFAKKEKALFIPALLLQILRVFLWTLGAFFGFIELLKAKLS